MEVQKVQRILVGDTGNKVTLLQRLCKTRQFERDKCNDYVLDLPPKSGIADTTPEKIKELNEICEECPNNKFIWRELF